MKDKKYLKPKAKPLSTLVDKTSFLHQVKVKSEQINHAQSELEKINLGLLKNTTVLNYENAQLLLGTDSQSVLARFYMQKSEILKLLRQNQAFFDLISIQIKLFVEPMTKKEKLIPKKRTDIPDHISYNASETLSSLCKKTKTAKLQESLTKFLAKHGQFKIGGGSSDN